MEEGNVSQCESSDFSKICCTHIFAIHGSPRYLFMRCAKHRDGLRNIPCCWIQWQLTCKILEMLHRVGSKLAEMWRLAASATGQNIWVGVVCRNPIQGGPLLRADLVSRLLRFSSLQRWETCLGREDAGEDAQGLVFPELSISCKFITHIIIR